MKLSFTELMHRTFSFKSLIYILAIFLFYSLGGGVARYLGQSLDWGTLFLGLVYTVLLFISGLLLQAFFDPLNSGSKGPKNLAAEAETDKARQYLTASLTILSVCCVLAFLIVFRNGLNAGAIVLLALTFALMFLYAVPPFKLAARGYGELVLTFWIADLVPALAFLINGSPIHRLIPFLTFPLTTLFLAMIISTNFQGYLNDMINGRKSLVIMTGWKLGMDLHNGLILVSYLIIGIFSLIGLSWNLIWPMLLPAPIFLFSVYEILRIKSGVKPRWSLLSLSGYAGMGCILYVLLFTLWIR